MTLDVCNSGQRVLGTFECCRIDFDCVDSGKLASKPTGRVALKGSCLDARRDAKALQFVDKPTSKHCVSIEGSLRTQILHGRIRIQHLAAKAIQY